MDRIRDLVGAAHSVTAVAQHLHYAVRAAHAPVVGALLVTCADETEAECALAFQQGFVRYCVPPLKFGEQAAFRIANLGGQYEWGAIRIAEQHYAAAAADTGERTLMVIKINAHTAFTQEGDAPRFGTLQRYRGEGPCCGALDAVVQGARLPAANRLAEALRSESIDRLETLRDPSRVDPDHRALFAAIASARLQARKAVLDIQDYRPTLPTNWLVIPSVTLNIPERDTEIVCGYYWNHDPSWPPQIEYLGLGDDPGAFELEHRNRKLVVTDARLSESRPARDHRNLIMEQAQRRFDECRKQVDGHLHEAHRAVRENKHRHPTQNKALLASILIGLSEVAPVPAAMLLFAHGAAGIHHTWRVHRLSKELEGSAAAKEILDEIHDRVEHMEPDQREAMIELLTRQAGG